MMIFIADDDHIFSSFLVCNVNVRISFHLLEKKATLKTSYHVIDVLQHDPHTTHKPPSFPNLTLYK